MLLDRQRTKFWQRIVFGFMAFLMGGFLVVGYSGVLNSCGTTQSNTSTQDNRVDAALKAVKADPAAPQTLLAAALAYRDRGQIGVDQGASTDEQAKQTAQRQSDLTEALVYYKRYVNLKDKVLGVDAKQRRIDAYSDMALIHTRLGDFKGAVSDYIVLTDLEPRNADNFLQLGRLAGQSGDNRMAYLAYTKYLEMEPNSSLASLVKKELKRIKKLLTSSSTTAPTPAPSGGN